MSLIPSQPRFVEIAPEERTDRQNAIVKRIEEGPRGRLPINLRVWLHNPDFVDVAEPFGLYVSALAPITKRQKEIVVLVGALHWKAQFEWHVHQGHAQKVGITSAQISAIAARQPSDLFEDQLENLTYELAVALHGQGSVPQELYARAMASMGHKGVSDLIGLVGLYTMIAMTLNFYDIPAPTGSEKNISL